MREARPGHLCALSTGVPSGSTWSPGVFSQPSGEAVSPMGGRFPVAPPHPNPFEHPTCPRQHLQALTWSAAVRRRASQGCPQRVLRQPLEPTVGPSFKGPPGDSLAPGYLPPPGQAAPQPPQLNSCSNPPPRVCLEDQTQRVMTRETEWLA